MKIDKIFIKRNIRDVSNFDLFSYVNYIKEVETYNSDVAKKKLLKCCQDFLGYIGVRIQPYFSEVVFEEIKKLIHQEVVNRWSNKIDEKYNDYEEPYDSEKYGHIRA